MGTMRFHMYSLHLYVNFIIILGLHMFCTAHLANESQLQRSLQKDEITFSFDNLGLYAIKFEGCNRIAQWKVENGGGHLYFHDLVTFRLCLQDQCSSSGCMVSYGEYILDMSTFLYYYLMAAAQDSSEYNSYDESTIEASDYTSCTVFKNFVGFPEDNTDQYYIGPYCSKQGGSIFLGLFIDSSCSIHSKCDSACFKEIMGYNYSKQPVAGSQCVSCSSNRDEAYYGPKYECESLYKRSGKCESALNIQNPSVSECQYIGGVKTTGEDGILRSSNVVRSQVSVIFILLFACSVAVGLYILHLRRKIPRTDTSFSYRQELL